MVPFYSIRPHKVLANAIGIHEITKKKRLHTSIGGIDFAKCDKLKIHKCPTVSKILHILTSIKFSILHHSKYVRKTKTNKKIMHYKLLL